MTAPDVPSPVEAVLRDVWAKVHVARFAHQRGETKVPDLFYSGVLHAEHIIEQALGYRPGSMASDPHEQAPVRVIKSLQLNEVTICSCPPGTPGHFPVTLVERSCRVCGCTDEDCSQCIEKTGAPCYWVEHDLCSACQTAG